jgi:hypothetical protein
MLSDQHCHRHNRAVHVPSAYGHGSSESNLANCASTAAHGLQTMRARTSSSALGSNFHLHCYPKQLRAAVLSGVHSVKNHSCGFRPPRTRTLGNAQSCRQQHSSIEEMRYLAKVFAKSTLHADC